MAAQQFESELNHGTESAGHKRFLIGIAAIWLALVFLSLLVLVQYASLAADEIQTSAIWPADSTLTPPDDRAALLVFLHPKCRCSVASIRQLALAKARSTVKVNVTAVFYCPLGEPAEWAHTDLWDQCLRISDLKCVVDANGQEARRFGVSTSGHLLMFDRSYSCIFDGGVTHSRAHEGASLGSEALTAMLRGEEPEEERFRVFGCALFHRSQKPAAVRAGR